jgi:hypothetical protein
MIYDVFGFSPQILQGMSMNFSWEVMTDRQGADLLSSTGARVYMPDFLKGNYVTADMFSGTDESVHSLIVPIRADEKGKQEEKRLLFRIPRRCPHSG